MSMARMKLPGKHKNNSTKSNRKERAKPEKELREDERSYIAKIKKYFTRYLDNPYFSNKYITVSDFQDEFNFSEYDTKRWLKRLENMGLVKCVYYSRIRKTNKKEPYRYEILFKPSEDLPNNILKNKFGQSSIKINGLPSRPHYKKDGEYMHSNMLDNTFSSERDLIAGYKGWAEVWSNVSATKKPIIFKNFIMKSDIISCHFLDVCKTLTPKERQKIVTKVKENSNAAFWAYFNCKLQNSEKATLLISILSLTKYHDLMLEILTSKNERETVLNKILAEGDIYNRLVHIKDKIIDSDRIIIARKLQKCDDQKLAVRVNGLFKFDDDEKDYFAHLVVAYKMAQEWSL